MASIPATPGNIGNHAPPVVKQSPSSSQPSSLPASSQLQEQALTRIRDLLLRREQSIREIYALETAQQRTNSPDGIKGFNPRSLSSVASESGFLEFQRRFDSILIREAQRILSSFPPPTKPSTTKPAETKQIPNQPVPSAPTLDLVASKPALATPLHSSAPVPSTADKFAPTHALYSLQLLIERKPLMSVAKTPSRVVTTQEWIETRTEQLKYQILHELEQMKKSDKFSAYQLKRFRDPARAKTCWDVVLDEAKWMALDFREERKWKIAMAYLISQEVLDYHRHREEGRHNDNPKIQADNDQMDMDDNKPLIAKAASTSNFTCPIALSHNAPAGESETAYRLPSATDQYVDPLSLYPIVPVSRVVQTRFKDPVRQPSIAAALPGSQMYCGPLAPVLSTFYSPVFESKTTNLSAPPQPRSSSLRPSVMWTSEEDEILLKLSPQYQFNWTIVAECVNSNINQVAPRKIPWDCYVRWQHLQSKPSPNIQKSRKDDLRRRAMRHIHFFDGINKIIKKREAQQQQQQKKSHAGGSTKSTSSSATTASKPNLTAHLSHQAIASRAGVDPKRWRTPLEQSERRQKLQATAQQRVQGMLMQQPGFPGGIPGRPNAPRPQGLFNGVPGMPGQPGIPGGAPIPTNSNGSNGGTQQSPPGVNRPSGQVLGSGPVNGTSRLSGGPQQMQMTQAQVQQLIQRQAMARQQQGQNAGSPPNIPGGLTAAQIAQMPPALAQRMLLARQQQALMQQQQQQRGPTPSPQPTGGTLPTQLSSEMLSAAMEEARKNQQFMQQQQQQQQASLRNIPVQTANAASSQPRPSSGDDAGDGDVSQGSSPQKPSPASKRRTRRQVNE